MADTTGTNASSKLINPIHPSVEDKLDEQVKAIYMKYQSHRLRADQVTYEEYIADPSRYGIAAGKELVSPPCPVGEVTTHRVSVSDPPGEIDVRIYRPDGASDKEKLPLFASFHGGGFVLGGLEDDAPLLRRLCRDTRCVVANVAYRLAPEFPHPVPATDGWAALRWLVAHADDLGIDTSRVAVGGLSAGACLAAAVAQMARDHPEAIPKPLVLQLLIVPVLDARYVPISGGPGADVPYESYRSCEFAPMLPLQRLVWFYNLWLGTAPEERAESAADVRASPMAAADLSHLAPASLHAAEVDPLRSEAEAYHHKLTAAGTPSALKVYKGAVHPFVQWDAQLAQGRELVGDLVAALQNAFKI